MTNETVGERIRALRGRVSRGEFADALGIGTSTLQRYEKDERLPDADALISLCRYCRVSSDWILFGDEKSTTSLNATEHTLIDGFRDLDPATRKRVLAFIFGADLPVVNESNATGSVVNQSQSINNGTQIGHNSGSVKSRK